MHDVRGMLIGPTSAHTVGQFHGDAPVRFALTQRLKDLVEALDAPLCAGEGALLFKRRRSRQHHVGIAAGLGEEDVLHHEQVEPLECARHAIGICVGADHVFTRQIHRLQLAVIDRIHHLVVVQALGGGELDAPRLLVALAGLVVVHLVVAG